MSELIVEPITISYKKTRYSAQLASDTISNLHHMLRLIIPATNGTKGTRKCNKYELPFVPFCFLWPHSSLLRLIILSRKRQKEISNISIPPVTFPSLYAF